MSKYEDVLKQELAKVVVKLNEKKQEVEDILKEFVSAIKVAANVFPSKDTILTELAGVIMARANINAVILVTLGWLITPLVKSLISGAIDDLCGKDWYEKLVKLING